MTIGDVNKLAMLARIDMSEAEKQEFLGNMESILGYIDVIKKATTDTPSLRGGVGEGLLRNVMREDADAHESGMYTEKILAQAPATQDGYVKVKQIL